MFDEWVWEEMFVQAKEEAPAECCGILTTDATGQVTVHKCENIQDKLHKADPEAHPRTSKEAYRMNDMHVMRIQQDAESAGGKMVAIYHSHIDVGAYFSEEDQRAALFDGDPLFPGVVYPVISVKDGDIEAGGSKVFQWDEASATFKQVTQ